MGLRDAPKIAVVDSDPGNCRLLHAIGQASDFDVVGCAENVPDGLALVFRTRPDCLITDYKFDGGSTGLDLIMQAKRHLPDLLTVMLTGWDINDVAAHVTSFQPDRILRKPVLPQTLIEMLEGVYGRVNLERTHAG